MSAEYSVESLQHLILSQHSSTSTEAIAALRAFQGRIEADERARIGWDKECEDVDRIIEKLGLTVEQARTEGGCLHLPRILNHIQETLDALAVADGFGKSMVDKYAAAVYAAKHPPAQAAQVDEDQAWDDNAERLTREAGLNGRGINPNATSIDDIFLPTAEPVAPSAPEGGEVE